MIKVLGLLLLLAGWFLVGAAIALLRPGFVPVFAVAGGGVELLGLVLLARQHLVETRQLTRSQEPRY